MKQFDVAAEVNNWTDSEKVTVLVVLLRGEALEILQTLDEGRNINYDDLVQHLEMRFRDKYLQEVYQAQLRRSAKNKRGFTTPSTSNDLVGLNKEASGSRRYLLTVSKMQNTARFTIIQA